MTATATETVRQALRATVARDELLDVLRHVTYAIPRRAPVPVLAGVLLEGGRGKLVASAFDYEVQAAAAAVAAGSTGSALVEAHRLQQMVRAIDKGADVFLGADNGVLTVTGAGVTYTLPVLPLEDYPVLPDPAGRVIALLSGEQLQDLARVVVAAGRDDTLPVLTGVLLHDHDGTLRAAATDRYRLAVRDTAIPHDLPGQLLVPAGVLRWVAQQFRKERQVEVRHQARHQAGLEARLFFTAGGRSVSTRLIDGLFPTYRSLLPETTVTTAVASSTALSVAVSQVAIALERNTPVRLTVAPGKVALDGGAAVSAFEGDGRQYGPTASKEVPADVAGDEMAIAFNPGFLLDGLRTLRGDQARLGMNAPGRPALLQSDEDPGFTYLLMPVRLPS